MKRKKSGDRIHNILIIMVLTTLLMVGYQNCTTMQAPESYQEKAFNTESSSKNGKSEMSIYVPEEVLSSQQPSRLPAGYSPYEEEIESPRALRSQMESLKK